MIFIFMYKVVVYYSLFVFSKLYLYVMYIYVFRALGCFILDWVLNGGWMIGFFWLIGGGLVENWFLILYFFGFGIVCKWRRVINEFLLDI